MATAQQPLLANAKICVDARHARRIADSLAALPDCRQEARRWQRVADSTQRESDKYLRASLLNLDAKRAAEASEKHQQNIAASNGQKYAEANRKAQHRTVVIVVLLLWNALTGYYIISH